MFGYIGRSYFRIEPLSPLRKCTTVSVAAHTLYEKTNYILPGPGGHLDLTGTSFEQDTEATVKVRGSKFVPGKTVRPQAGRSQANWVPHRFHRQHPGPCDDEPDRQHHPGGKERVADNFSDKNLNYYLNFIVYGGTVLWRGWNL